MCKARMHLLLLSALVACYEGDAQQIGPESVIPAGEFARQPRMWNPQLSPDGKHVAYMHGSGGFMHFIVRAVDEPVQKFVMQADDKESVEWFRWVNNERLIFDYRFVDTQGGMMFELHHLGFADIEANDVTWIVRDGRTFRSFYQTASINWLPDDPEHILISVDGNGDGKFDMHRTNVITGEQETLNDDWRGITRWITDQQGNVRVGYGYEGTTAKMRMLSASGEWLEKEHDDLLTPIPVPQAFAKDPTVGYFFEVNENGFVVGRTKNTESGDVLGTVFESDSFDAEGIVFEYATNNPVGIGYTADYPTAQYFDTYYEELQKRLDATFPDMGTALQLPSRNSQRVLVHVFSDRDAGSYYIWDLENNRMRKIGEQFPGLPEDRMRRTTAVKYRSGEGTEINAYLTTPTDSADRSMPAIVLLPPGQFERVDKRFSNLVQFLVSRGYVVLQPNLRGAAGFGNEYKSAVYSDWGLPARDVADSVRWLVSEGIADPNRVCVVGEWFGAYVAALTAVEFPTLTNCVVGINGFYDLKEFRSLVRQGSRRVDIADTFDLSSEEIEKYSPYHRARELVSPMLIISYENRLLSDRFRNNEMSDRLRRFDNPVRYVKIHIDEYSNRFRDLNLEVYETIESYLTEFNAE